MSRFQQFYIITYTKVLTLMPLVCIHKVLKTSTHPFFFIAFIHVGAPYFQGINMTSETIYLAPRLPARQLLVLSATKSGSLTPYEIHTYIHKIHKTDISVDDTIIYLNLLYLHGYINNLDNVGDKIAVIRKETITTITPLGEAIFLAYYKAFTRTYNDFFKPDRSLSSDENNAFRNQLRNTVKKKHEEDTNQSLEFINVKTYFDKSDNHFNKPGNNIKTQNLYKFKEFSSIRNRIFIHKFSLNGKGILRMKIENKPWYRNILESKIGAFFEKHYFKCESFKSEERYYIGDIGNMNTGDINRLHEDGTVTPIADLPFFERLTLKISL